MAHALRDQVIDYYERTGTRLDTPAGRRTLDTNSSLAADRGRLLLRLLAESGGGTVAGKRVLDLGAGFGALSVYLSHLGAEVVAVDPRPERMQVGVAVARRFGLALNAVSAEASQLPLPDAAFHVVVVNNALCYVINREDRRAALAEILRVLLPSGWLVMRDPNRLTPLDPFSRLPLVATLPPRVARVVVKACRRHRSDVRLTTPMGALDQLHRAGFAHPAWRSPPGKPFLAWFGPYHHVVACRPASESLA